MSPPPFRCYILGACCTEMCFSLSHLRRGHSADQRSPSSVRTWTSTCDAACWQLESLRPSSKTLAKRHKHPLQILSHVLEAEGTGNSTSQCRCGRERSLRDKTGTHPHKLLRMVKNFTGLWRSRNLSISSITWPRNDWRESNK